MAPALLPGDRLLVEPMAARPGGPRARDIVVLRDPNDRDRWLVKRVAALGPSVTHVVRSGVEVRSVEDPRPAPVDAIESIPVPAGTIYVLSDAGPGGRDSRTFGTVSIGSVLGVVWWRYGPAGREGPSESF